MIASPNWPGILSPFDAECAGAPPAAASPGCNGASPDRPPKHPRSAITAKADQAHDSCHDARFRNAAVPHHPVVYDRLPRTAQPPAPNPRIEAVTGGVATEDQETSRKRPQHLGGPKGHNRQGFWSTIGVGR